MAQDMYSLNVCEYSWSEYEYMYKYSAVKYEYIASMYKYLKFVLEYKYKYQVLQLWNPKQIVIEYGRYHQAENSNHG